MVVFILAEFKFYDKLENESTEHLPRYESTKKSKMTLENAHDYLDSLFEKKEENFIGRSPEMDSDAYRQELNQDEKVKIKEETGWSDKIIDKISNMKQYDVLKDAQLKEVVIKDKYCLVKEHMDLTYTDKDGITNADRIARGLPPIDKNTDKPIELHHLGQKADSPLVELNEKEHRTGEYENGKKNQSLWHDNSKETEVHGSGNDWDKERREHWKERYEMIKGEEKNE